MDECITWFQLKGEDTSAILNSIISDSYYGMLRWQIHTKVHCIIWTHFPYEIINSPSGLVNNLLIIIKPH